MLIVLIQMSGMASAESSKQSKNFEILCVGAFRPPVEEMRRIFAKENGIDIQISYSPANVILQQLKMHSHGDIYIPADRYYTDEAVKAGIVKEPKIFAYLIPVIMVQKGNPHKINKLSDLTKKSLKVGLVDERIGAIGRLFAMLIKKNHIRMDDINVVYHAPMVGELGNAIKLKAIDAAVVWKSLAMSYPEEADYIAIPRKNNIIVTVSAGIIKTSENKEIARKFIKYMTSKSGKKILEKYHYPTTKP